MKVKSTNTIYKGGREKLATDSYVLPSDSSLYQIYLCEHLTSNTSSPKGLNNIKQT